MGDEVKKVGEGAAPAPAPAVVPDPPVTGEASADPSAPTDAYVEGSLPAAPDAGMVREAASRPTPGDLFIRQLHAGPPQVVELTIRLDSGHPLHRLPENFLVRILGDLFSLQFRNKFASIRKNLRLVYEIISKTTYVFRGGEAGDRNSPSLGALLSARPDAQKDQ